MVSTRDIRQQNAERRLRHASWAEPRNEGRMFIWGAIAAGLLVLFMAVRP